PSNINVSVTFTAIVSTVFPGTATPTGMVEFQIDNNLPRVVEPINNGQAILTTSTLTPGPHTIQVFSPGFGGNLKNSQAHMTYKVNTPTVATMTTVSSSSPNARSEEHTSELQSDLKLVCRRLLKKKVQLIIDG